MGHRLCISSQTGGFVAAGIDGLWEGGNPTVMARSREEAVGKLVLQNLKLFGLELSEATKGRDSSEDASE